MIGRAGRGAERADFLVHEVHEARRVQQRLGLLIKEGLVGRAAALGDEVELVGVTGLCIEFDLRRQVVARVLLVEHVQRGDLGITQVGVQIGARDALGDGGFVVEAGEHVLPLLTHDDGGAGILAHGQDTAGREIGVL